MDPLVRFSLAIQHAIQKGLGLCVSFGFGAYLVAWYSLSTKPGWDLVVALALLVVLSARGVARFRGSAPKAVVRRDVELFTALSVAVYAIVLQIEGSLTGPFYATVYALIMLTAAFARPRATVFTVIFVCGLEVAISAVSSRGFTPELIPHLALIPVFAGLNAVVFQAEIARVRRLSRERVQSELERLKDAARSYRLLGAPSTAAEHAAPLRHEVTLGDEERLLRSSVTEIHLTIRFTLSLLKSALGLNSAVLLWLTSDDKKLVVREATLDPGQMSAGPFSSREGVFAAALGSLEPASIAGPKARLHAPYYREPEDIGFVCALPLVEHRSVRGLLVVDRNKALPLTASEEALLWQTASFVLRAVENERLFVQLDHAKVEQSKLYRAVELFNEATTEVQVIQAGVRSARDFTAFDFAAVTLFRRTTRDHEICAVSGTGADDLVGRTFKHNTSLVAMVVANRHALPYRGQYESSRQVVFSKQLPLPEMPSLLVLPLVVHDTVLGTLVLGSQERGAFGDEVRPILEVLARHFAVSLSNARMLKRLEDLATTDGMTGLFNKRTLTDIARQKLRAAERFKKPLSVLVCDIDFFKKVNDTYGHDIGDLVIKGFADVLKRTKRDTDAVARFGGEEFVLVCEQTDTAGAKLLAERIRSEIENTVFHSPQGQLKVTCSVGVATYPAAGQDWEAVFKSTDEALYSSKRGGRNRVTIWTPTLKGAAA